MSLHCVLAILNGKRFASMLVRANPPGNPLLMETIRMMAESEAFRRKGDSHPGTQTMAGAANLETAAEMRSCTAGYTSRRDRGFTPGVMYGKITLEGGPGRGW